MHIQFNDTEPDKSKSKKRQQHITHTSNKRKEK